MDEVKAIITLRSGKQVDQPVSIPVEETKEEKEVEPEDIIIKEDSTKKSMPPLFPQALKGKKKASNQTEILEVLRQVKINIPLLDMIKQVPTYAKFLKDLCIMKRGLNVDKKAFLTEQVVPSFHEILVKYKDPSYPTISVNIRGTCVDKALLDLGASVNLLPYSVYKQLGLGELKPTTITLYLDDRFVKDIVEDVLVKVDKFYYPVDFVVLDTEPMAEGTNRVPIVLGRPFLATSNAIINCWNGFMQLTFGNMTLELNIFHLRSKHKSMEEQEPDEVCVISPGAGKHSAHKLQEELMKNNEVSDGESNASVTPPTPLIPPVAPKGRVLKTKRAEAKIYYSSPHSGHGGTSPPRSAMNLKGYLSRSGFCSNLEATLIFVRLLFMLL